MSFAEVLFRCGVGIVAAGFAAAMIGLVLILCSVAYAIVTGR